MMKDTNRETLRWIFRRIKRFIPAIILTTILSAVISLSSVVLALVSRDVLDSTNADSGHMMLYSGLWLFGVIAVQVLLNSLTSIINVRISGRMTISLRDHMFSAVIRKRYPQVSAHHSGDLLNRFTSDIEVLVSCAVGTLPSLASMVTRIVAGAAALLSMNYRFAILVLVVGSVFPMLGRFISKKYKYMHKEVQQTEGQARAFMQESFANLVVIKSFLSERPILNKLNEYMERNLRVKIRRNFISVVINMCLYSFFTVGYYGVLLWGAVQIAAGALSYGTLNAFLQLISQLRAPLQNISGILPQYYSAIASAERLIELEHIEDEPPLLEQTALEELAGSFRSIHVRNLAFAYDNELILKNCSFEIRRNCITAITGESGCGKSTLFRLLLGLYEPSGGSITINGDIPVGPATRGLFAYVPQGNMILSGTIRDNITLCNPEITDEAIEQAARAAVIYDYIKTLPDGFDTVLSERGAGLSEGQVQRLSIARALLFDTPVLLLDESTSALDEQTETELLSNIKHMTGKTVLFITHRNTSISVCDHILHAADGRFTAVK